MIYDAILGREVDRRNFYKKIKASGLLAATRTQASGGRGKPSQLYRFDRNKYETLQREGYAFGF